MFGNSAVGKRLFAAGLCAALLLSTSACQENPKGSIIVHKDMDNLISRAQEDDPSKVDAADIVDEVAENFETYVTTIENESLGVTVNVNAKVDVPQVDTLNVYRVERKRIDQEFVNKVRKALMGEKEVYFTRALYAPTKADYERWIKEWRDQLREAEEKLANPTIEDRTEGSPDNPTIISEEEFREHYQVVVEARQATIDALQEDYENAPDEVDLKQYPSDGQFLTYREYYERYPEIADEYRASAYPDDETLDIVADSGDGQYQKLSAKNSEDGGSGLIYYSCPGQYVDSPLKSANLDTFLVDGSATMDGVGFNKTVPENFLGLGVVFDESTIFTPIENDETTITMEEAIEKAKKFLEEIDLPDFAFAEGGLYNEPVYLLQYEEPANTSYYRNYYILLFYRDIDSALLTQSSGRKESESGEGVDYRQKIWPGEMIQLRINDAGIVGFDYDSPIEITETVVENAVLKPFSEIKEIFEKMVCVANADDQRVSWINIDRVRLSYSRISEKDSFDTGLVVPVWSFEGKIDYANRGQEDFVQHWMTNTDTIMAINAIDGSIIDGTLGY